MSEYDRAERLFRNDDFERLAAIARRVSFGIFKGRVYLRGLIEYSNKCSCNCLYCGIRRGNDRVNRYRLTAESIFAAVDAGFKFGLKTFVLQGGEDLRFSGEKLPSIVAGIKDRTGGAAAVTLSSGILPREVYSELRKAGADRYLIRFETSDPELHKYLRTGITLERRLEALEDLRGLGYQTGSGFMVGLPGENEETILENVRLCRDLKLDMAGIGPFIPHQDTPLAEAPGKPFELSLKALALLRIACPDMHIPATTAAGSIREDGREQMLRCGANVVMPNITPAAVKKDYLLYPGKVCLNEDGLGSIEDIGSRIASAGGRISFDRADGLVSVGRRDSLKGVKTGAGL